MKVGWGAWSLSLFVVGCLLLALQVSLAQKKPAVNTAAATRGILIEKAHALDSRGRPDMAIQLWQQILLSDPNNAESLAGLAKDLKLIGSAEKANDALDRLRKVNPNDPNISKIQALTSTRAESDQLRQAGDLARQGKLDDAMRIYRQLYEDHPPDGDIALAYYQTLYGTATGKAAAISGMRALADRNPGDSRFAVELGVMLTYDSRTRAEGIRILETHPKDSNAQTALRQALIWDSANPASSAELRQYLKDHPQDRELSGHLKENEYKLAQMNSGIARTPAERAAFAALNAHKLDEAQVRFMQLLQQEPDNGRVAAGMGFLRMQQKNFGGAISYLTQAEQNGYKAQPVEAALATSRFWYTMGEASQAFDDNQLDLAASKYKAALAMNPRSPEALNGLAGLLTKEQQYAAAAGVYEQLIKAQPGNADGWRGLFFAYARDKQNQKALAISARFPGAVKASSARDPEYLRTLASIYQAQNRNTDAQRVLAMALSLPFPANGTSLKSDTKLQYAGILMEAKRYEQAAALYTQILADEPANLSAWMGMISAHHELAQDTLAIADVERMPAATYESALADPGFLSMLAAIYQQANQFEIAQGLLERSAKLQIAAGGQPSVALQLQLAAIYMLRNNTAQAYAIYRQVLVDNPDRLDAWKGLISTLLSTNRNTEALQEIALIPAPVRKQLEADIDFVQTEASLYAATGDIPHAIQYMNRVEAHYAKLKTPPPANIEVQNAWLLYNTGNDRTLYPALMRLGSRNDLTVTQRETVQDIWASWSVRRAGTAMDNGNVARAVDILDAASQAFPDNMTVRKAVAGGYVRVGRTKESLALFKTVPMQDATSGDFQGAVGAALSANDKAQAELWLRQALDRYPHDPAILSLAARYEQARGDNQRAADYWRASLAAMPTASAVDRLAHTLVYPEQDMRAHKAVTAADLQHLLDPNYEPFAKTTKLPSLPAYGADPYDGSAPVVLPKPGQTSQQSPVSAPRTSGPADAEDESPYAPASNPAVNVIPAAQTPNPQMFHQQSATQLEIVETVAGQPDNDGLTLRSAVNYTSTLGSMHPVPLQRRVITTEPVGSDSGDELPQEASAAIRQASLGQVQTPDSSGQPVPISLNAPHSQASDAWKGLIFSLTASNRNAEAVQELAKIPLDVRRQLEADIEFVQGIASLYVAVDDTAHAIEYLRRVENFYLLHRTSAPVGLEVQHAWLLYNLQDDAGLYPVLTRLDIRQDRTAAQRQEVDNLWASWAVRRAGTAMTNGNLLRGVEILQAASQDYPDNMNVRRAVAGAYARVGRAADALTLFKTIPMDDASSGDYQGAIAAALAARNMAQAEAWLRQALGRFPSDPQILGLAARFEQSRGNNERATDFWRASLAVMPPGSTVRSLESGLNYPPGAYHVPGPGDTKRLLDPRTDPLSSKFPPLPSYSAKPSQSRAGDSNPTTPLAPEHHWTVAPSNNPLPLPASGTMNQAPNGLGTTSGNVPAYIPQSIRRENAPSQPILIEQSASQEAVFKPAINTTQGNKQAHDAARKRGSSQPQSYSGKMNLPPSEQNIDSIETYPSATQVETPQNAPVWTPGVSSQNPSPATRLRISSQPMGNLAAKALALFADQTDGQLTQGSATVLHAVPNAPARSLANLGTRASGQGQSGQYAVVQYTPSAQEAATGAYSAPKQQAAQPQQAPPEQVPAPVKPAPVVRATPSIDSTAKPRGRGRKARQQSEISLGSATASSGARPSDNSVALPGTQQSDSTQLVEAPSDVQSQPAPASSGAGLTDEELQQRNLPPLRGPWVRVQRGAHPISPREEAEVQLRSIESGYSAWLGGAGLLNYRSGGLGFDHLTTLEAPFEASFPLGYHARLTIVAKPVFLDSGQADGTSVMSVLQSTTAGTKLTIIPQPIGTLTTSDTTPPAQQNAVGFGGEVQLAFPHLAIAGGYTPTGFLVSTFLARGQWRPANGPFTFNFSRDSVKDTQLSYSGLRDPAGNTLGNLGQIWGGVVANQGNVQFTKGDAQSGFYFGAGGQYITGYNVEKNTRIDGSGGAYWRLLTSPEYGNLSIGVNFFAMHYAHNESAFTHGMGGYFSPQGYFLGNVPFTWAAHYGTHWHYNILGGLGVQAFQESQTPLWPLASDKSLETSQNNPLLPDMTSVGPNYDLRGQVSYQISPHWFAGGNFGANNTRNYTSAQAGFFVRYLFREQPSTAAGPTGIFPTDGVRPFTVP